MPLKMMLTWRPPFVFTYWNMSPPFAYSMEMARYSGVRNTCTSIHNRLLHTSWHPGYPSGSVLLAAC